MIVKMFKPQFAPMVRTGIKKQTIRPEAKRPPKVGQEISLREWEGKPYRTKQRILLESKVPEVQKVEIWSNRIFIDGVMLTRPQEWELAQSDGFNTVQDMVEWFNVTHGLPFKGTLTKWA